MFVSLNPDERIRVSVRFFTEEGVFVLLQTDHWEFTAVRTCEHIIRYKRRKG